MIPCSRSLAAAALFLLGRGVAACARLDRRVRDEVCDWADGTVVTFAVAPFGPRMSLRKSGGRLEHLGLAAAKLERIFAPPVSASDRAVRLDVRAGFAMAATGSAEDALRHAESALRRAAERRASWHLWRETEGDGGEGDLAVEHRIEGALDNG